MTQTADENQQGGIPNEWPPPEWPGCPSRRRYGNAAALAAQADSQMAIQQIIANPRVGRQEYQRAQDAATLCRMIGANQACRQHQERAGTLRNIMSLEDALGVAGGFSDSHNIGMSILRIEDGAVAATTRDHLRTQVTTRYAALSRHPSWVGISPMLKWVQGLEVLIFCAKTIHPSGETGPHAAYGMVAMSQELASDLHLDNLTHCSQSRILQGTTEIRTLEKVLRYHSATPHLMDPCMTDGEPI